MEDSPSENNGFKKPRLAPATKKEETLSQWYFEMITKGEMCEHYDASGCYFFRSWSFATWKHIRRWISNEIEKLGSERCYFPVLVAQRGKTCIADFTPEVACAMKRVFVKWAQSQNNPNQWDNLMRWEFKQPQAPFRTREFLWQEGHSAFANRQDAIDEADTVLDLYARIFREILAVPVIRGRKTEKEKFPGAENTQTLEVYVPETGEAIQGATVHHLGQNLSKMYDIVCEDPDTQEKQYAYQNSWGIAKRTLGATLRIHQDIKGLIKPPRAACLQVVLIPCVIPEGVPEAQKNRFRSFRDALEADLRNANVKVKGDYRAQYSYYWKAEHWEKKGVPIVIQILPGHMALQEILAIRRDTGEKLTLPRATAVAQLKSLLDEIQENLLRKASRDLKTHTVLLKNWSRFAAYLDKKHLILAPFCGDGSCEEKIRTDSRDGRKKAAMWTDLAELRRGANSDDSDVSFAGARALCIPFEQPIEIEDEDECIHPDCDRKPLFYTLFGITKA